MYFKNQKLDISLSLSLSLSLLLLQKVFGTEEITLKLEEKMYLNR